MTAATGSGSLTLTGSAPTQTPATSSGSLTLSASGAAVQLNGSASLTLSGSAATATTLPASGGSLSLTGSVSVHSLGSGTATASLTLSGIATGVGSTSEVEFFTGNPSATLGAVVVTYTGGAQLAGAGVAALGAGTSGLFSQSDPYLITGTGGSVSVPAIAGDKWLEYHAPFAGSMSMTISSPSGTAVTYYVYDVDGDELQSDTDGELGLVLFGADTVKIKLTDPAGGTSLNSGFTITWSYAARASSRLLVRAERATVLETPGAISLNITNGYPSDTVVFSIVGPTTLLDFTSATLTEAGVLEDWPVSLPALQVGNYVMHCEAIASGAQDVSFSVLTPPLSSGDLNVADSTPPVVAVTRWTFYDLRDPGINWTLQRNPKAWTNMNPPNNFTHAKTIAPDGQILTWEAGSRPWRMEFSGYIDDQAEYERFDLWRQMRRRLWLVDHRNRAWLVTLEHFDAQARIVPNTPWAHDYTVRALIFKEGT